VWSDDTIKLFRIILLWRKDVTAPIKMIPLSNPDKREYYDRERRTEKEHLLILYIFLLYVSPYL
jgi:hypothetical protein